MENKKIRLLSDDEIACIAAGEVIESPASIFKELLENAIDAGSTEITIDYTESGLQSIIITDNGCGVSQDDLITMFKPHTTSKLPSINDIYYHNDRYFGFRGEALAAISSVSKTTITSKLATNEYGYALTYNHGKQEGEIKIHTQNPGTTVSVTNLFQQIPARKKYLQSAKNIEKEVKHVITGIIAMHPNITFSIYKNGILEKHYYSTKTILDRMFLISTQEKDKLIQINYQDMYVSIEGLISASEYGWYDKSKILLFVNHRIIKQQKLVSRCIKPYYAENFIKRYPELYLHIIVNPDQVDVNVHPRKEEVLFLYQQKIETILENVIRKALSDRTHNLLSINNDNINKNKIEETYNKALSSIPKTIPIFIAKKNEDSHHEQPSLINQNNGKTCSKTTNTTNYKSTSIAPTKWTQENNINLPTASIFAKDENQKKESTYISDQETANKAIHEQKRLFPTEEKACDQNGSFIGILDNTYILLLQEKSIICIDQHALHEKILYEKYMSKIDATDWLMHPLLIPHKITKNKSDIAYIKEKNDLFTFFGFDLFYQDNTITINGTPTIFLDKYDTILDIYLQKFILANHTNDIEEIKKIIMHEIYATKACKNAIKAGDKLNQEMVTLLLKNRNSDNISFCPHGRPTYYEITSNLLATLCKRK